MKRAAATNLALFLAALLLLAGCSGDANKNAAAEAPPPAQVEHEGDANLVQVDHPAQFPLATASEYKAAPQLTVTGVVTPDVSRTVPVISIASGRVVEIRARLGDTVKKGQLLLRVQSSDIAGAYSDYRKAVADELLANTQFERAKGLYDHGAISLNDFQVAEDTENKAKVDVETTAEHLRVLGAPLDHPSGIVDIVAPVSGVITDQQVTNAAGVQGLSSTNPFTISDLTVRLDPLRRLRERFIRRSPGRFRRRSPQRLSRSSRHRPHQQHRRRPRSQYSHRQSSHRSAAIPVMRPGMFVTATFRGQKKESHAAVPASAILHLHDRDWVYVPAGRK